MTHYSDQLQKVTQYIEEHLSRKISLQELAEVANFSKYHFSRVFTSIIGMTPYSYITNRRLEQSLHYLMNTDKSILEISILCGFESASNFNAAFKKHYKHTPSEIRKSSNVSGSLTSVSGSLSSRSNISLPNSNSQQEINSSSRYIEGGNNHFLRRIWDMNITIKELPDFEVAYVRHVGSYLDTYLAWNKLGEWAAKHNLFPPNHQFIGISLDDPSVTAEFACRYDACVTIHSSFEKNSDEAEIMYKTLPGGLYALYQFYDTVDRFAIAYQVVFGQWLPNSDYIPEDKPSLEFSMNNPAQDPEGKAKIDLYVPIRKRALMV